MAVSPRSGWRMPFISRPNITFSTALSQGSSSACWNTMPRSWPQLFTSLPSTVTRPALAWSSPMAIRSAVVLPQPDGPMSTTISPSRTVKLIRSSAWMVWTLPSLFRAKRLETPIRLTSPTPMTLLLVDELQGFLARAGIGEFREVDLARLVACLHRLLLHPIELRERQADLRVDRMGPDRVVKDIGRTRIVGGYPGDLARQGQGLVAMR